MTDKTRISLFLVFMLIVAAAGGILFGYHTAILSGILPILEKKFHLSEAAQGFLVSIVLLGGLVGALFGGKAADTWGRKTMLILTAAIFCLGTLIQAISNEFYPFLIGRFISGLGVGLSSVVSPMYIAEISPPKYRGAFVSVYQFMVAAGILLAYAVNVVFGQPGNWQYVFYLAFIPPFLQLICLFFVPESPAWLQKKFSNSKVAAEMQKKSEAEAKEESPKAHGATYILVIGLLLSIFQQITGVNTVFYYAPKVLINSGAVSPNHSLGATVALGLINLIFTCVVILLLDKLGRRFFLFLGLALTLLGQILLAISFLSPVAGLIGAISYIIGFAVGLGPITWVLLSEIFPLRIRGKAMGLALFVNWLANYVITLSFLILLDKLGITGTFTMYGIITVICLFFVYFYIPETKGKTLDQIEGEMESGKA